ncbi:MAG: hypothetical protein AAB262_14210 [Elusimicrobiota bacterium]
MMPRRGKLLSAFLVLASVLPGAPVFSQVRVSPPVAASLRGSFGASASAPSALLTPALSVNAPAVLSAPAALAPAAPREGPSAQVSGETAKSAADALFDAGSPRAPTDDGAVAAADVPTSAQALSPAGSHAAVHAAASVHDPGHVVPHLRDRLRDQLRYAKLTSRSFFWYMYTHIKDMWPAYIGRWKKAGAEGPVAVSSPRAFFTAMRVTGMSGRFYALGGSALEDDLVIQEFRGSFARYFDGLGVGAREKLALERFMARAKGFNAEKRAHTNMYKNIRDPLIRASTMRPDQLADFFDALLPPEKEQTIRDFQQSGRMDETREVFFEVLMKTLNEEDANAADRVRAAIVLGSFATGSAGPSSDFDVEALVNGAGNKHLGEFSRRLTANWTAAGYHQTNPVTVHDNASWPSWGLVNIVQTRHYIVVSAEPALVARLSRQAYENPAVHLERGDTLRGSLNRTAQRALVAAATLAADLRALFGLKPA